MFAKERQNAICALVRQNGAVTTAGLTEQFQVSIETVRRDLLVLERSGLLTRVHGGAVTCGDMQPFPALQQRNQTQYDHKLSLSRAAAGFLRDGDILALDSGSTANVFAQVLRDTFHTLTVVTYSRDIFDLLCDRFEVILCSGSYIREEHTFCGSLAQETLAKLHVQKVFLCPSAISLEHGICDFQPQIYPMQKQLLLSGEEIFVLADSSKFEKKALYRIAPTCADYRYITDTALPDALQQLYTENGIPIFTEP